ncbi:MAG: hypothetical protein EOL93_10540, partial [Epsilonproteobacteria bacterium]|nr:hypothetical protein [Campylobacterota bacterium]
MALPKTLPLHKWRPFDLWFLEKQYRDKLLGELFPEKLSLLWSASASVLDYMKSIVGSDPVFSGTPTLSSGGVIPGDGPSFTDVVSWQDGGTLVVEFTATTASADIVGDVAVFGPVYVANTGLKAKDGTNEATCATSWDVGDVVT